MFVSGGGQGYVKIEIYQTLPTIVVSHFHLPLSTLGKILNNCESCLSMERDKSIRQSKYVRLPIGFNCALAPPTLQLCMCCETWSTCEQILSLVIRASSSIRSRTLNFPFGFFPYLYICNGTIPHNCLFTFRLRSWVSFQTTVIFVFAGG